MTRFEYPFQETGENLNMKYAKVYMNYLNACDPVEEFIYMCSMAIMLHYM